MATIQMLDIRVRATDGRELLLVRRTEPEQHASWLLLGVGLTVTPTRNADPPTDEIATCRSL